MELASGRRGTGANETAGGERATAANRERGMSDTGRMSVRLAAELESVAIGRRWLRESLEGEVGQPAAVGDALQALSEVLTNAILHGDGERIRLGYAVDGGQVAVTVVNGVRTDGTRPRRRNPVPPDAESGRGLELVDAFTEQWGIEWTARDEVAVWFRVEIR